MSGHAEQDGVDADDQPGTELHLKVKLKEQQTEVLDLQKTECEHLNLHSQRHQVKIKTRNFEPIKLIQDFIFYFVGRKDQQSAPALPKPSI